jgi:hypothetical protein
MVYHVVRLNIGYRSKTAVTDEGRRMKTRHGMS